MTYTPGPWVLRANTDNQTACIEPSKELLAQGRGGIAHVYKKDPLDEGYANQRLIAAAPDMLAALEGICEFIDNGTPIRPGALIVDDIKFAIVKARGDWEG